MEAALTKQLWDLILADHAMPRFSAPQALELLKQHGLDVPFIIVSGFIEEETAVAAMRSGAHDYVMKDRLARLVPAVERELREAEVRRARASYAEQLRKASEELEVRVEKRTADLKAANLKLSGQVLDADNKPVAGAYVSLYGEGQPNGNVRTDRDGRFTLDRVC